MNPVSNYSKSIAESTHREVESTLPRAAEVVQVKGRLVRVRFTEEAVAGETWFPCTVMNVPIGTWGAVHNLRGSAGYFQPIGWKPEEPVIPPPTVIEFGRTSGSPTTENTSLVVSSFSQAKSIWSSTLGGQIPETTGGTWTVKMTVSAVVHRSTASGGVYLFTAIGAETLNAVPRGFPQDGAYTIARTIVVKGCTGSSSLEVRYGGQGTAGVTTVSDWSIDLTATKTA